MALFSRKPTARQLLAEARGWRYEREVTLPVLDRLAQHLGLPAGQPETEVTATDCVAGNENDHQFAIYSVGAATVWCVYLPTFYPSTPLSGAQADTEFARSVFTDRGRTLIAALPTTAGAIDGEHLWISTTADPRAYRDEPDRVLDVLGRLLELADAIVWPHLAMQAKFFANREQVRRFQAAWNVPEVVWDKPIDTLTLGFAEPATANRWLRDRKPYKWLVSGEPRVSGLTKVLAEWQFSADHEFEALELRIDSLCDPGFLAEKLSLAADAASFPGWQPADLLSLRNWIRDMTDMKPHSKTVGGYKRLGFVLFDLDRILGVTSGVSTFLKITLTDKALDGTPLNHGGGARG